METQEMFNTMMENAIVYLQEKGIIPTGKTEEIKAKAEMPNYAEMVRGLQNEGVIPRD